MLGFSTTRARQTWPGRVKDVCTLHIVVQQKNHHEPCTWLTCLLPSTQEAGDDGHLLGVGPVGEGGLDAGEGLLIHDVSVLWSYSKHGRDDEQPAVSILRVLMWVTMAESTS